AVAALVEQGDVLRRRGAGAGDVALVEQNPEQLVVRGGVLRRALDHGAQMLGRLLREAVLREDLGLGEVLGDELEVLAALFRYLLGELKLRLEARRRGRTSRRRPGP